MGWKSAIGGFSFLGNPRLLIALIAVIAIVYFRKPIAESLGGLGTGLGTFGSGINTFISQVSSPRIAPTLGLNLEGIFKEAATLAGQKVKMDLFPPPQANAQTPNQNTTGSPAGVSGGNNQAQSNQEANPNSGDPLSNAWNFITNDEKYYNWWYSKLWGN